MKIYWHKHIIIFFIFALSASQSFGAENQADSISSLPISLQEELAKNAAPPNPSLIDYSFSNPNFTPQAAQRILTQVLPKTAQELAAPEQFYRLIGPCYAGKLDKVYYHLLPPSAPKVAYLWFNNSKGCYFAAYYLGRLEKASGLTRGRICPINNLRFNLLFTPENINRIILHERTGTRTPEISEFMFRLETCLRFRQATTEDLQALFSN